MILFRERDLHVPFFSGDRSDELFFKARDERAAADGQRLSFRRAAFKLFAVYESA
jgi:hypothetical protein